MNTPTFKTKCTVRLQKSPTNENDYYLYVEAYPVYENEFSKPKRKTRFLNRVISSIVWDNKKTTRGSNHKPKRNVEGVPIGSGIFFADVVIESYGGKRVVASGFKKSDARTIVALLT